MSFESTTPRLVSSDFAAITVSPYEEDVNIPPSTILRAALLLHKIRYSVSELSKELSDDEFFQSEVFRSAPRLEEVLPLVKFVSDKMMLFTPSRLVREKSLAVIRYVAELLLSCLNNKRVLEYIPLLEAISNQIDA